jgi:hypothetical protein
MNDDTMPLGPAVPSNPGVDLERRGAVRRYIEDRGFGFISRDDGPDLFFHQRTASAPGCMTVRSLPFMSWLTGTARKRETCAESKASI